MKTIYDTRHENLLRLIERFGSIANLNEALGRKRNDASLALIKNKNIGFRGKVRQMGDRLARELEERLQLPVGWLDSDNSGIEVDDLRNVEPGQGIFIPELENWASMGDGAQQLSEDIIVGGFSLSPEFVSRLHVIDHTKLRVVTGYGDSMSPTIESGDKVLVDGNIKDVYSGGIFVLKSCGKEFIKRVSVKMDGTPVVSSDNPAVKLAEELNGDHQVDIIGKVIFIWHGRQV